MIKRFVLSFSLACCLMFTSTAGFAAPETPVRKTVGVETLKKKLDETKSHKKELESKLDEAGDELKDVKKSLVEVGSLVRRNEELLQGLDERMNSTVIQQTQLTEKLKSDYGSIANLILALERMRRVPPEALIVRPGAPLQTAQSALLMQSMLPAINKRAASLAQDLQTLQGLQQSLLEDRQTSLAARATLQTKYTEVSKLAQKRETLYKELNKDYKNTAAQIERISKEARSMQEFLDRIKAEDAARKKRDATARTAAITPAEKKASKRQTLITAMPHAGKAQLPVSGMLVSGFGETDTIGAKKQGLTIKAQPRALVMAPMGGVIKYAGTFKNYGLLVIIEHPKDYHSLVGGMENIDVIVGQAVDAGEPIGKLPSSSSRGDNPALYYELRLKGQPVNPSKKFAQLKS